VSQRLVLPSYESKLLSIPARSLVISCKGSCECGVSAGDPCPRQSLLPQSLLLLLVHAGWGTGILLEQGEVTVFMRMCLLRREVDDISTSLSRGPHSGVHEAE
jgi:hypothetical protein